MSLTLTYLFDPLCGWCYGAAPALARLAAEPGVQMQLAPTGLFSGAGARVMDAAFAAYAWGNDERIAQLTGQPFSPAYRERVLGNPAQRFDSGPATQALAAVQRSAPQQELAALHTIQHARYVDGQDVTDRATLAALLRGQGLADAAQQLEAPDDHLHRATLARTAQARALMQRHGAPGVPALVLHAGTPDERLVRGNVLLGEPHTLLTRLQS